MSKLLQKYEEFLEELEKTVKGLNTFAQNKETFTKDEWMGATTVSTAYSILTSQGELNRDCIKAITKGADDFKNQEELDQ